MRFELIDRVIERQDDQLIAVKCVSAAEEYLADHFPGFAVLTGVLMLEALVQTARTLVADRAGDEPLVLAQARNVRYRNMVRPGQTLQLQVKLRKQTDQGWQFEGTGTVEGQTAVQARFSLEPVSRHLDDVTTD